MYDEGMLEDFRIEADEIMEEAEVGLLELDKGGDFDENFNAIFRAFHSLKGAAGMFGIDPLQSHMHKLESLFEAQKETGNLSKELIDYFLDGIDGAKKILDGEEIEFTYISDVENVSEEVVEAQAEQAAPIREAVEERVKKSTRGLIYIVDDEVEICKLLSEIVADASFEVKSFLSAKELLDELEVKTPDLILSDINMPKMTGVEMIQHIYEIDKDIPVVFISGYITKEVMMKSLDCGAMGFIEKPFDENKVINTCNLIISRKKAIKLLNRSIDFILYQFSDLDEYLKKEGRMTIRNTLKDELEMILKQRKLLKELS